MGSGFSKRRFIFFITLAFVIFLECVIYILSKYPGEYTGPVPDSELVLTKVWNGEVVRVPGLLDVPEWMKKTWKYRKLLAISKSAELTWKDSDGNTYIADAGGRWKVDGGKYSVAISGIVKKRPNGSLENYTLFGNHKPSIGSIYDETGKKIMSVSKGDGYAISFFKDNQDNAEKKWQVNSEMNIYSEQVLDPNGNYHFTYNLEKK